MNDENLNRSIGRLEGKVDSLIVDIKSIRDTLDGRIKDLDTRVAKLEKKQFAIVVVATIIWGATLIFLRKIL